MNTLENGKQLTVTFVGFSEYGDIPCYKDQNDHYYFDMNEGKGPLFLYTGAYLDEDCGEICGEPDLEIKNPVICNEPFSRSPYELDYMLLNRWRADCDYFLGYGNAYEGHLCFKSIDAQCDAMEDELNLLPDDYKPEWLTIEQIKHYRDNMKKALKRKLTKGLV